MLMSKESMEYLVPPLILPVSLCPEISFCNLSEELALLLETNESTLICEHSICITPSLF